MKMKRMNKLDKQGLIKEINERNNKIHNCDKKRFEAGYTRNFSSSSDFFFEPVCVYITVMMAINRARLHGSSIAGSTIRGIRGIWLIRDRGCSLWSFPHSS